MQDLRTERVLLRGWEPSDEPEMARINRDPEVTRHLNRPLDDHGVSTFFDAIVSHWEHYGYGPWALESLEPDTKGRFLGFTGLASVPSFMAGAGPGPELGWRLDRAVWGRGLATEAALAARDDACARLGLAELISIIHPENRRSQRVAIKLGMRRARSIENRLLGRQVDVWQLSAAAQAACRRRT
jgi:RimJ/RimL family protein N-acetyltransferase